MYNGNMIPIAPAALDTTARNIEIQRKKRTRAKRSCDKCRIKKTRCDGDVNQPCTKCRISNSDCTYKIEQKKRGPTSGGYVQVLETRLKRMETILINLSKEKEENLKDEEESDSTRVASLTSKTESLPPPVNCSKHLANPDRLLEHQMEKLTISDYQRTRYIGASSGIHFLNEELFTTNRKHRIEEDSDWFVQKLNKEEEEHIIIKSKEIVPITNLDANPALDRTELFSDIPDITQTFLDYLIHMYFTRVHGYCPVLNKIQFLEEYYYHVPSPPDKYVLFTIAYIGLSIFKTDIMHIFPHMSEEKLMEMTELLKVKAFKILSFVYKRSMISTVQALMLLSMFTGHTDTSDEEDASHWFISGIAIRMAQDLGLHRDCSSWVIPDYEIELRKRIWYSAYLMDKWIAADLGRPISIIDSEFEVGIPNLFELNYQPTVPLNSTSTIPTLMIQIEESRKKAVPVYSTFVHQITLSQIVGQTLVSLHSPRAKHKRDRSFETVDLLSQKLQHWKSSLPQELRFDERSAIDPSQYYSNRDTSVLHISYGCAQLLIYRPFIKEFANQNPIVSNLAFKALSTCTSTATVILTIIEAMERDYFNALPWNLSVYCIFQAAIVFLHNAKSGHNMIKEHGRRNLIRCAKVYESDLFLKDSRVVKVLTSLVANFDISMEENRNSPIMEAMRPCIFSAKKSESPGSPLKIESTPEESSPSSLVSHTFDSQLSSMDYVPTKTSPSIPFVPSGTTHGFMSPFLLDKTSTCPVEPGPSSQFGFNPNVQQQGSWDQNAFNYLNLNQLSQFDLNSFHSQVPLSDIPNGIIWDDWESFLKSNTV